MAKENIGRPSKLDERTVRLLEQVFVGGSTIGDACDYAGISASSYYAWMQIARDIAAGYKRDDDHPFIPRLAAERDLFLEFLERIKKARVVMRIEAVGVIRVAAQDGNWQAAAWLLERSDPEHWGRKVVTQNSNIDLTTGGKELFAAMELSQMFQLISKLEKDRSESDTG